MCKIVLILALVACMGNGRRVQTAVEQMPISAADKAADHVPRSESLAQLSQSNGARAAFIPGHIGQHRLGQNTAPAPSASSSSTGLHPMASEAKGNFGQRVSHSLSSEHRTIMNDQNANLASEGEHAHHIRTADQLKQKGADAESDKMEEPHRNYYSYAAAALGMAAAVTVAALAAKSRRSAPVVAKLVEPVLTEKQKAYINDNVGNNVTPYIAQLVGRNLHLINEHPLGIIKDKIFKYFDSLDGDKFEFVDDLNPLVSAQECFDDLLIPKDHPGRKASDTYYVTRDGGKETSSSEDTLLRTHTSAHQSKLMRAGKERFLCTGDVYRRDEIDASHFPVFHQMEGVKLFDPEVVGGAMSREEWIESDGCKLVADDLKKTLEGMCDELFGPVEKRWIDEYFPFTEPSFELEIFYNGDWMEVLGCGVVHTGVLENVGMGDRHGWAFGLGLERLAMVLFSIPDIRLFWSQDERFTSQFKAGKITTFKPYSDYPPVFKDIAFWIPDDYEPNDFFELARGVCGEQVENIERIDNFFNPKSGKTSHCYRITYRDMDRTLTNEEVDELQFKLRDQVETIGCELR